MLRRIALVNKALYVSKCIKYCKLEAIEAIVTKWQNGAIVADFTMVGH